MYKPKLLTPQNLADYMECSLNTAYTLCKSKGFPSIKIGRRFFIPEDSLIEWIHKKAKS